MSTAGGRVTAHVAGSAVVAYNAHAMKRIITWIALVVCGGISASAVALVIRTELSPAVRLDRAGLEAWLDRPSHDVASDPALRRAAWLLEQDFHGDYDWTPYYKTLAPEAQRRFRASWALLLEDLFLQRARHFAVVPPPHRPDYLGHQLSQLAKWYVLDERGRHVSGPALFASGDSFFRSDSQRTKQEQRLLQEFRLELGKHAASRLLKPLLPGAGERPEVDD